MTSAHPPETPGWVTLNHARLRRCPLLSVRLPELAQLSRYEEREWSPEDWTVARWSMVGVDWSVVVDGVIHEMVLCIDRSPVLRPSDHAELIAAVRMWGTLGPALIAPSDGPVAYQALVLLPRMGYRTVQWFADDTIWEDADELFISGLSAAAEVMGDEVFRTGICVDARKLGPAVMA